MMDNHSKIMNNNKTTAAKPTFFVGEEKLKYSVAIASGFIQIVNFIALTLLPVMEIKELKNNL
jgi:hypothetical protein